MAGALAALSITTASAALSLGKKPDPNTLLPVEQAYVFQGVVEGGKALVWNVQPGYYLYKARIKLVDAQTNAKLKADLPAGVKYQDPEFGEVEIYKGGTLRVGLPKGAPKEIKVSYQGCAEAGICYPPQTRTVRLP
jgi:thiol:disulfide interchange protein DsbD